MKKHILPLLLLLTFCETASSGAFDFLKRKYGIEPLPNELYEEGCGECHFAYQPGWLPKASWKKLMAPQALEDHFEENAEFDDDNDRLEILDFLVTNAANRSSYKLSKKIMHSLRDDKAPLKITETRYIKRKHAEIPSKYIQENKKVRLLSNCDSCHKEASKGKFTEDTAIIPGQGRWIHID